MDYDEMMKMHLRDRNEAFLSMDKAKIQSYFVKYGMRVPADEKAFWSKVHKTILSIDEADSTIKRQSYAWLEKNGFTKAKS